MKQMNKCVILALLLFPCKTLLLPCCYSFGAVGATRGVVGVECWWAWHERVCVLCWSAKHLVKVLCRPYGWFGGALVAVEGPGPESLTLVVWALLGLWASM
jgi:hypothetical protein